jgi:hypothetical protein
MSLRRPIQIRRRLAPGARVEGRWVPGPLGSPVMIMASVQPAQTGDYDMLEPLLEGRQVEAVVRVYTDEALTIAAKDSTASGDVLDWPAGQHARPYVFMACSPWQSGIISHFRYLAALMPVQR